MQPQKSNQDISNIYEKMYREKEEKKISPPQHIRENISPSQKSSTPRRAKNWFKVVGITILVGAILSVSYYFLTLNQSIRDTFRFAKKDRTPSRYLIARHVPKKRAYRPDDLVLNGISFVGGKKVALINDEIYEAGDIVNGKTITSIGLNEVKLRDDEKIFTIKVR